MNKVFEELSEFVIKQFKLFWILLTAVLIVGSVYINWYYFLNRAQEHLNHVATQISNHFDGFVEDLFQEAYSLPIFGTRFSECKTELYPYLEHITLNNLHIAGITITDNKRHIVCSSLPDNYTISSTSSHARSFSGPYDLSYFDQPIYLVQQNIGNYQIGILVLSSVVENALKVPSINIHKIALYDNEGKKNLLSLEQSKNNEARIINPAHSSLVVTNTQQIFAADKIQNIDQMSVVVVEPREKLIRQLLYIELGITLFILCLSALLYFLLKKIITDRYSLKNAIKRAIKNKEFYPEYQPIFDCESNSFTGVEILLRWKDQEEQLIMPDLFIAEAENTGLIVPITLQIIEISLKDMQPILQKNSNFHLAYNISAIHFTEPSFFVAFHALVKRYDLAPDQVIFELTERELLDKNNSVFIDTMHHLRTSGYSLAVDDYGTGHASISYLQHFPFNYLKIDKLFIQAIGTKAITESLNDAIINMAHGLNLTVIAEGVETKEQFDYLSKNGVRFLQGWYFSKALPIDKLVTLFKGEKR
ncbi:EAL domain-containing protein [Legionella worsleiensis]|uniref:Rtn protein n=1 Tax=Legionella worsleiensis TaxID=45076 RepID=A0A0W1A671_9GAMM|nr:EAL domain-containing protein [Legionella worsleiensis]KTD76876.1 Rtn protein [Legionella worsleiensis]STY33454.1 Rtn protein [Legionella worsleiensis]